MCKINIIDNYLDVAGEDDDQTQLPLSDNSLLFNDSLDEEVDPKALLELAERADLPLESAVGEEQQQADVSNYHSPTACEPHKDLDDSLVMDDLDGSKQPSDISHSEEATGTDGGAETSRLLPANENASLDNDGCKVSPKSDLSSAKEKSECRAKKAETSSEKESSSIVEKKKESTEAALKATGPKVKPSFGKKKKGFTPPKVATAEKTSSPSTCQSVSSEQPKSNVEKSKLSKISNKKAVKKSNEEIDDSTKEKSAAKTSKDSTDTALTANGSSTKTSSGEGEKSSESSKKTQGKKEKEKDEKAKEREMKKQEKEEKKKEKEKKKAELERQRNEKKLELERKKAEREQKKMEKELKKMEKEQKKSEKQQAKAGKKKQQKKTVDTNSNEDSAKKNEEEPFKEHTDEEKEVKVTQEPTVNEEGEYDTGNCEAIVCEGTSEHIDKDGGTEISHVNSEAENSTVSSVDDGEGVETKSGERDQHSEDEKENFPPNGTEITMNDSFIVDDSPDKIPVVVLGRISNNPVESSGHETKKEKNIVKMFTPPKSKKEATTKASHDTAKRKKVDGKKNDGCSKTASKKLKDRKGKKRKTAPESDTDSEPEAKRSKPANYHGPVWVQCDNASCKKWRLLKDCDDPAKVPSSWVCSMNSDPDHNNCSAEEERWSDELGDSQEFVESPYIPGSIVWAKMDGYPW